MKLLRMLVVISVVIAGLSLFNHADGAEEKGDQPANPVVVVETVVVETSEGTFTVELWPDKAPVTVKNFLSYVDEGFYTDTVFHRVIGDFMIQGGGFTANMNEKQPHEPIKNEASAELKNDRGTIAMARTNIVDSATSQFFINVKDNGVLNHRDNTPSGFGYAVFGKVTEGMDVVDRIKGMKTKTVGPFEDVPVTPVVIKSVKRSR